VERVEVRIWDRTTIVGGWHWWDVVGTCEWREVVVVLTLG
jgi:hypothetical protein